METALQITLPLLLQREVQGMVKEFHYGDEREFIEDALRHRLLALKKISFLSSTKEVRTTMEKLGVSEAEIMADFESFRHSMA